MRHPVHLSFAGYWWLAVFINGAAMAASGAVIANLMSNRSPLPLSLGVALAVLAALALFTLIERSHFRLTWNADNPKLSLAPGFHALLLVIGLHVLADQTLLDRMSGLWAGAAAGLVLGTLAISLERPISLTGAPVTVGLLVLTMWSIVQVANCCLDSGPGITMQTTVIAKYSQTPACSGSGKYGTCTGTFRYALELSPIPENVPGRLGVDGGFYCAVQSGEPVCLTEHFGRFGARWIDFGKCRTAA